MAFVAAADGARLHYDVEGDGPLVVLLHGGTGTGAYDWEFLRGPLARHHRVVTPDLRGHGRSNDPNWLLSLDRIADDVVELIDQLGERPAAIVGFSIGATAALRMFCLREPVADALVIVGASPVGHPEQIDAIVDGPWPRALRELRHEHGEDAEHWRALRRRLAESWGADVALDAADLARVTVPVLVVGGDHDVIEPVETQLGLARALPRGELLIVPDSGHFVIRTRPRELTAALHGFLERHAR